ncbi:MAG: alpha/beta fold hydrolase [Aphanocapsa sp. GSE-SYN-MK-11-07L]|jgi:long-chain acyl-CoA synthetase|nr:alpha/beta fold hydrolase [Aphanocapsa sp. GSE-SYN-MK-11-07L]
MKHLEGTFKGFGDCHLYFQSWHPESSSQAIVVLVHGLGGHSGVFQNVVEYLVPQGYEVYALDLRGHGRSSGQRGHINRWLEFRADLAAFLQQIRAQRSGCPIILWGHSLGGTIVLDYGLRSPKQIQGLIVTAPALGKISVPAYKLKLGKWLSKLMPRFSLRSGLAKNLASRDPIALAAYLQDPLRHEYGSARLVTEFFATVNWINDHAADLQIPLLIMHGSGDRVTAPEGSRAFFQHVLFPDKEHREYPGSYHDLYIDLDYHRMFTDVDVWLDRHLEGAERCQPFTACGLENSPSIGFGKTLPALLDAACNRAPNASAFNQWTETGWQALSNQAVRQQVEAAALGLLNLGLTKGDRVAFLMHSDLNFAIADQSCLLAQLVDVPIDLTQTLENIVFVLQHSEAKALILSNLDLLEQVVPYLSELPELQQIVIAQVPEDWPQLRSQSQAEQFDPSQLANKLGLDPVAVGLNLHLCSQAADPKTQICLPDRLQVFSLAELQANGEAEISSSKLQALRAALSPQDLATIIYIPDTNGQLQGVMLSHANLAGNALATFAEIPDLGWGAVEVVLAFLPFTHVFARLLLYSHTYYGHSIYFSDPNRVLRHLQSVQPTILATVPLLLEKIYSQILERGSKLKPNWVRLIFNWAVSVAQRYQLGQPASGIDPLLLKLADRLVLRRWRSLFGGRLKYLLSGGAGLKTELANVFAAAGVPILQGYGLTQASGVVCFNRPSSNQAGSVGTAIPGMEVAIAADGEILLRGPYITAGYYKNPAATEAAVDPAGWWQTGDLGKITPDGRLTLTGLKKALFKLSTGKYIAPRPLEARLQLSPLVNQVVVIGAERKFCAALIFPDLPALRNRCRQIGLNLDAEGLLQHPCVIEWYQGLVDAANCHSPYWAILKRFRLINAELTVANQLLTAQGQIDRCQVNQRFRAEIAALYGEVDSKSRSKPIIQTPTDLAEFDLTDITCPITPSPPCPLSAQSLSPRFTT